MSGHHVEHHVAPKSLYYLIFAILMVGTAVTVVVAYFDLGVINNVVMLAIACTKALLVVHVLHARPVGHAADVGRRRLWLRLAADHVRLHPR